MGIAVGWQLTNCLMGQESSVMLKGDLTLSWPMRGLLGVDAQQPASAAHLSPSLTFDCHSSSPPCSYRYFSFADISVCVCVHSLNVLSLNTNLFNSVSTGFKRMMQVIRNRSPSPSRRTEKRALDIAVGSPLKTLAQRSLPSSFSLI